MTAAAWAAAVTAVHWSTAGVPRPRQFGYWRELICAAFLDLSPEAAGAAARHGFRGHVTQRPLGRLAIAHIGSQAQHVRRTEADIARSPKAGYYANLQLRGACRVTHALHAIGRAPCRRPLPGGWPCTPTACWRWP
jgi:AraC family transcriptional regulator, positive regulator of tynA and feaB